MAPSRPKKHPLAFGLVLVAFVMLGSCAQVTGLSDDYRFDLEAGAGDSGATSDSATADGGGDGATDAATDARPGQCNVADRTRATTQMTAASGDVVPNECRTCLAGSCCAQIDNCAKNNTCNDSMKCIFQCQKENGIGAKAQCVNGCPKSFFQGVGACIQSSCPAPACNLQ